MNNIRKCTSCTHWKTCIIRIKLQCVLSQYNNYFERGHYAHINQIAISCRNYLNLDTPKLATRVLPLAEQEKKTIEYAMQRYQNNREHVARALGIGERTLYRKLKRYKEQDKTKGVTK